MDFRKFSKIDWESFYFDYSQRVRVERLRRWANSAEPLDWEVVDDLLRDCFKAGFKRGAWSALNGVNVDELWLKYFHAQKKILD